MQAALCNYVQIVKRILFGLMLICARGILFYFLSTCRNTFIASGSRLPSTFSYVIALFMASQYKVMKGYASSPVAFFKL